VNPRAGGGSPDANELREEAERRGIDAHVLAPGEDAATLARSAETSALGVAGGDGSLGAVAAVAVERKLPFVCVPFGTRNHFARDLGIDRDDPVAALSAFTGVERRVDIGRVGERLFLNNVSLGLYANLVHRRERRRSRREFLARLRALSILARHRSPLGITIDGEGVAARVVVVANNHYRLDVFSLGERARLDAGALHLYVARGLFRSTWTERTGTHFTLDARAARIRAAIDGEPEQLALPVDFRIEPLALRVLVPGAAAAGSLAVREEGRMHDQPEPTEEEQEQAVERVGEEEEKQYPAHQDPPDADDLGE
jgi:diacylglycerol kinase family enzyme